MVEQLTMVVDATITIGNIIEIATIAGGGALFLMRTGGDIRVMKTDMTHLKGTVAALSGAFDKLGTVLTQVAVQDTRIVNLERRIDELSHGHGFVQRDINGEYPR